MKIFNTILVLLLLFASVCSAQFPGAAGTSGSTAIYKDSSIFTGWASGCTIQRGYQDIANPGLGYASTGDSSMVLGQADGIQVVSLGDGGQAIVSFNHPVKNGPGFDFAVFENGFIDEFLELAFVEVSSDGVNFYRFKATSNTQTDVQMGPFDYNANPTLLNNLAGKYRAMYGTPFDLEELSNTPGLNLDSITYIKIIDVVGTLNPLYASYDQNNHIINDHYPTAFPQGGFDLDAIGVIHQNINGSFENNADITKVSPVPTEGMIEFSTSKKDIILISILNQSGNEVYKIEHPTVTKLDLCNLQSGIYLANFYFGDGTNSHCKIIKIKR